MRHGTGVRGFLRGSPSPSRLQGGDTTEASVLLLEHSQHFRKKRSINDVNIGTVNDLYQTYEILKYIVSFEFNGQIYRFAQYSIQDRIKFLNNLSSVTIEEIKNYIKDTAKKAENIALAATSQTSDEKIIVDINTIFFSSTTRKEDSEEISED